MTVVVSDTSVLCYLALIGRLSVLQSLFGHIVVPEAVWQECLHPKAPEALRTALTESPPAFVKVVKVDELLPETHSLDPGEAAAISQAWQFRSDCLLLLDEKQGRTVAAALGLRLRGILGIVAEGKHSMRIDLIGVAGSGMSGLASLLIALGHKVSGSDKVTTLETEHSAEWVYSIQKTFDCYTALLDELQIDSHPN